MVWARFVRSFVRAGKTWAESERKLEGRPRKKEPEKERKLKSRGAGYKSVLSIYLSNYRSSLPSFLPTQMLGEDLEGTACLLSISLQRRALKCAKTGGKNAEDQPLSINSMP